MNGNAEDVFSVETRVAMMDDNLYGGIETELTRADKRSLLTLQNIIASIRGSYSYVEIGSYRGGSIQPHLLDIRCSEIHSIDPRPDSQPDERGGRFRYLENSVEAMLQNLRALNADQSKKVFTYPFTAPQVVVRGNLNGRFDLVFVDGEHTDTAVQLDFAAAVTLSGPDSIIVFHDAPIIYRGLAQSLSALKASSFKYVAFPLPDSLFVVAKGSALPDAALNMLLSGTGDAYLRALVSNQGYRDFYRLMPFRLFRSVMYRIGFRDSPGKYEYGSARRSTFP